MIRWACQTAISLSFIYGGVDVQGAAPFKAEHPRMYFVAADLPQLRAARAEGVHANIWANLIRSADWCAAQPVRREWIAPVEQDPQYENLYDRFYAAMHDAAIIEGLSLTSALSDPENDKYLDAAKQHLLASATIWKQEATLPPNAGKAYAVLRVAKAMAVGYDALFPRLNEEERQQVRDAVAKIGDSYYQFFQTPTNAGEGYNKHHGSVEAAPLGIMALAMLGDLDQAQAWLDLAIEKHVKYLLPQALTPSGTNDQSSNFWASTLHYRMLFFDPLKRVTGRDLAAEFPEALPGRIALAAVAGKQPRDLQYNENNRSILFAPCYGQIDYWSPALVYLARSQRRPIYQYLALWDESLGSLQHTRFITPTRKEELLFNFGPYVYLWYDPTVAPAIEDPLPLSFEFPEPEVGEGYVRASYEPGGLMMAARVGSLIVHAGGRPILVDEVPPDTTGNRPTATVKELLVADDGKTAMIRCIGPESAGLGEQRIELKRPSEGTITRHAARPLTWWHGVKPERKENVFSWPDGTTLTVEKGKIVAFKPDGFLETKIHFGGMKFADPHPFTYATTTVEPVEGVIVLKIFAPAAKSGPKGESTL